MFVAYRRDQIFKDVGTTRQLFVDDDVIAVVKNVTRTLHSPKKHPSNPLISRDQPWEVIPIFRMNSLNVLHDPEDQLFKCYYEDYYDSFKRDQHSLFIGNRVYYAQSRDGVHWDKPGLGKHQIDGRDTNTVFSYPPYQHASDCSIILDYTEDDPARRYKMAYYLRTENANVPKKHAFNPHSDGVCLAFSPNGTDWTPYDGNPIFESWGGDVEMLTYDPIDSKYIIYGRYGGQSGTSLHPEHDSWFAPVIPSQPEGIWGTRRRVYRTESSDCLNWSMPELLLEPGHSDNLDDAHYGFMSWRAGDLHLGFLTVLHQVKNDMDFYLLYSRDGLNWSRLADHRPFVSREPVGSYDCFGAELSNPPLEVGDELWIYYGGMQVHHDWWFVGGPQGLEAEELTDPEYAMNGHHLCLSTLRKDGYVSIDAGIREGYLETKPLFSAAPHLFINGRCEMNGSIRAEITDTWGNVWEGFGGPDCTPLTGDSVRHQLNWTGGPVVNRIPGSVKLRFILQNAELYGFEFGEA